jgi:uncharacterized protein
MRRKKYVRLFFATDLHGSEVCFRKLLSAGPTYEADIVIMGGDCTGKMVVPLIVEDEGRWVARWAGETLVAETQEELETLERQIRNQGFYPVRLKAEEMTAMRENGVAIDSLFRREMISTLERWIALAEERLTGSGIRLILTPGNDDEFEIDEVIEGSTFVEPGNDSVLELDDGHELLSLGWANPTPWDTPRETTEEDLRRRIDALAAQIQDMSRAIFNIHVPPYGSGLDFAPELENGDTVKRGGAITGPVGSTAVRDAILEYQPMLSLHGHIHESRAIQKLGRTVAINPGSSYSDWRLQGVIVDLERDRVRRYVPVTG